MELLVRENNEWACPESGKALLLARSVIPVLRVNSFLQMSIPFSRNYTHTCAKNKIVQRSKGGQEELEKIVEMYYSRGIDIQGWQRKRKLVGQNQEMRGYSMKFLCFYTLRYLKKKGNKKL